MIRISHINTVYLIPRKWMALECSHVELAKMARSHIIEWNEPEGSVKRAYHGLIKRSVGIVQFDTTKNRFLAVAMSMLSSFGTWTKWISWQQLMQRVDYRLLLAFDLIKTDVISRLNQ
ncbi:unnamed protein product [Rhodiola kirilowii]